MTRQEKILRAKATMMLAAACRAKFDKEDPNDMAALKVWEDALAPYPAVVVQGAIEGWIRDTKETYGRLPAIGAIIERIEIILSMTGRRRFKEAQARRQTALAEHLGRRREARRVYLSAMRQAAKLPPAEAEKVRMAAHQTYADAITAIDRAISLAAADAPALEEAHNG